MSDKANIATRGESLAERKHEIPVINPVVDVYENDDEILLHADMPGVAKEDIVVNVDNGKLIISGVRNLSTSGAVNWEEFSDVEYRRTFSVPQSIDVGAVNAELKDGVLKLHLPKSEAAKPRLVEIKAA
jgi:HSP20 family molecular chaperone IbpA